MLITSFPVFAATISLQSQQQTLQKDEEFGVSTTLTINQADGTNYYLRGVFFKEGTTSYCGFTWNSSDWYSGPITSGEGWKHFYKVTLSDKSWSGHLKAKIDTEKSECKDSGTYNFKLIRYTESGSTGDDTVNSVQVEVLLPTPSPTPSSTPQPTSTKTPSQKPSSTSPSLFTVKPNPTIVPKPTNVEVLGVISKSSEDRILATSTISSEASDAISPQSPKILGTAQEPSLIGPVLIVGGGMLFIAAAVIVVRQIKSKKEIISFHSQ